MRRPSVFHGPYLVGGPPHGLSIDGGDTLWRSRHRGGPGDKAALELSGVEHGHDVAEVIVRRHAILERTKAAKKVNLLAAEERDAGEGVRSRQHREQA